MGSGTVNKRLPLARSGHSLPGAKVTDAFPRAIPARSFPYPAVSLKCFHERVVSLCVKIQPFVHVLQEVQVLKRGVGFLSLFPGSSSLVRGALQVICEVHPHGARQDVVHDHDPDVNAARLHAVQSVKFGQESPWVLVQILKKKKKGKKGFKSPIFTK